MVNSIEGVVAFAVDEEEGVTWMMGTSMEAFWDVRDGGGGGDTCPCACLCPCACTCACCILSRRASGIILKLLVWWRRSLILGAVSARILDCFSKRGFIVVMSCLGSMDGWMDGLRDCMI